MNLRSDNPPPGCGVKKETAINIHGLTDLLCRIGEDR